MTAGMLLGAGFIAGVAFTMVAQVLLAALHEIIGGPR